MKKGRQNPIKRGLERERWWNKLQSEERQLRKKLTRKCPKDAVQSRTKQEGRELHEGKRRGGCM